VGGVVTGILDWHYQCLGFLCEFDNRFYRKVFMKLTRIAFITILAVTLSARGQGTVVFDQQSSTNETPLPGVGGAIQDAIPPWGQSFTPSLPSIGFIRLLFDDGNANDGLGATVYVNIRSGSISGAIIGSTDPVAMPNNFAGTATFLLPSAVTLTPGTAYYFEPEPVQQSGGTWNIVAGPYNYPGGIVFSGGFPATGSDLWFREGIIVPEPSSAALMLLAAGTWLRSGRIRHP